MKTVASKDKFTIQTETSLLGFETEQVYKVCQKDNNVKICNLYEDKNGVFHIGSVCHVEINMLMEALKFAKEKIK